MTSKKGIIDRAFYIANGTGTDGHSSPVIDNAYVAETLFPHALREAVRIGAGIPNEVNGLKREYSLTLASGEVSLPSSVLEECLDHSSLYVVGSEAGLTSYEPRWIDYQRVATQYSQLGYFTIKGTKLYYTGPGESIGTSTAAVRLNAVGLPDVPATITDAMTISDDLAERTVEILAKLIRGVDA